MSQLKRILVPTDFSKESEYALQVAADIARTHQAEIIALHMLDIPETILTKEESAEYNEVLFFMKLAKNRFTSFLDKDYLSDVNVQEAVQHHTAFDGIIDSAKKENADLIVMGSHGASGFKEVFVGSNTEKVVRTSDIPVLVIKDHKTAFNPKKMVFACNFVDDCIASFHKAKAMASELHASLELLYINTPNQNFKSTNEINDRVATFIEKAGGQGDLPLVIFNDYSVEQGISNYTEQNKIDLIGIPTHGRKGIAHMLMGSIGESLANHATIPVMTFKI